MSTRPDKQMVKRIVFFMVVLILCLSLISGKSLIQIMLVEGDRYQTLASEQQLYDNLVTAPRGDIYDCNMKTLATSSTAWTVYITPNGINKLSDEKKAEKIRTAIAAGLSEILGMGYDEIYEKTTAKTFYVTVKKKIEKDIADKIREFIASDENKELELTQYIGLDETTKRYYPNDTLASTVIGFVGNDNQGLAGVESYYDNELTGVAGRIVAAKNAAGIDMRQTYQKIVEAQRGKSLVLTIDSYVQYVSEKYLDAAVEENQIAERGAVVTMNVNTGEIIGLAISGDFNPNEPFKLSKEDESKVNAVKDEKEQEKLRSELLNRQWRNKAVSDTIEPGSVFKIFTASTALEENLISKNSTFNCHYSMNVAGQTYHCHKTSGHGTQNLAQAISNSCNPAFITIGQMIGVKTFSKYFEAFGLNGKTGIDLPGEAMPTYHKVDKMGITELSSSSFGQTFNITPIQMLTIAAASVNGGYLVQPHVVSRILDEDGKVVSTASTEYRRQVISESTSSIMREMLEYVIQNGAKNGIVPGYRIGGKTGTSQKVSKILSTGNERLYIGSYVGIAPIDNPQIAVYVMLDEPKGNNYYGGTISAPVGAKVMAEILPYLGYEPHYTDSELKKLAVPVPNLVGAETAASKSKLTSLDLTYRVVGSGKKIVRQLPEAESQLYRGGTVILYTDATNAEQVTVPNMIGKTATEANSAAAAAGINIEFSGNTASGGLKAYSQSIAAGQTVAAGTIVTVSFRDESTVDMAEQ